MTTQPGQPDPRPPCPDVARTMTCRDCVEFLLDYLDGVVPDDERFKFESHLAFCPDCATYLDNYRKAASLVQGLGREERAQRTPELPTELVRAILDARKKDA